MRAIRWTLLLTFSLTLTLTIAGCPSSSKDSEDSSASRGNDDDNDDAYWKPYQFKGTETFHYELEQSKDGKIEKGSYEVAMSQEGGKYKVEVEGELGDSSGSFSTTVNKADDLPGVMIAQTLMNPWAAPLVVTMFTPAMMGMFAFGLSGGSWEVGSKWSRTENGKTVTMEIPKECKYAGQKGRLFRMTTNDEVAYESCVSSEVALPLYVRSNDKGKTFEITLKDYSE